jgi:CheY-like chemotaxis protein
MAEQLKILCIDDNKDILDNLMVLLTKAGFGVYTALTPANGLALAKSLDPDLILLDIMMPEMNGYDVCKLLQQDELTTRIPVVFLSALTQPQNKVSALAAGGRDYLVKPFDKNSLLAMINRYAGKKTVAGSCAVPHILPILPPAGPKGHAGFSDFKLSVLDSFKPDGAAAKAVMALQPADVYKLSSILGISPAKVARFIAGFAKRPCFPFINPDDVKAGVLPEKFAMQNNIAAVDAPGELPLLAISNPFNFELQEMIHNVMGADFAYGITEPSNISVLYKMAVEYGSDSQKIPGTEGMQVEEAALNRLRAAAKSVKNEINEARVKYLTGKLLQYMAAEKPDEMRIEAGGTCYLVRTGAAGALADFARLNRMTGNMVVARLKALGGMDILERNKPQAGAFAIIFSSENYRLALATEPGDFGETLVLKPSA